MTQRLGTLSVPRSANVQKVVQGWLESSLEGWQVALPGVLRQVEKHTNPSYVVELTEKGDSTLLASHPHALPQSYSNDPLCETHGPYIAVEAVVSPQPRPEGAIRGETTVRLGYILSTQSAADSRVLDVYVTRREGEELMRSVVERLREVYPQPAGVAVQRLRGWRPGCEYELLADVESVAADVVRALEMFGPGGPLSYKRHELERSLREYAVTFAGLGEIGRIRLRQVLNRCWILFSPSGTPEARSRFAEVVSTVERRVYEPDGTLGTKARLEAPAVEAVYRLAPAVEAVYRLAPAVEAVYRLAPAVEAVYRLAPAVEAVYRLAASVEAAEAVLVELHEHSGPGGPDLLRRLVEAVRPGHQWYLRQRGELVLTFRTEAGGEATLTTTTTADDPDLAAFVETYLEALARKGYLAGAEPEARAEAKGRAEGEPTARGEKPRAAEPRVPTGPEAYRRWYLTWQKVKPLWFRASSPKSGRLTGGALKRLGWYLGAEYPDLACTDRTLRDIIKAGLAGTLDCDLPPSG